MKTTQLQNNSGWTFKRFISAFLLLSLFSAFSWAQTIPYTFTNKSTFADADVYVAIVGITSGHVWIDCKTGAVKQMSVSDNTVTGPTIGGNTGPGANSKYANCFTKLSDIPNKTVNIPLIAGCRIFISFKSQMYLYFFGYSGSPSGYAGANLANATDPNQNVRFEMIELTYATNGLWSNTTRVDAYQYPMGLEVWGNSGFYKKVGELKTHDQILAQWKANAPSEFQVCLDATKGIIQFPTKKPTFSTTYLDSYINSIWTKYASADLVFNAGDAGVWKGRVSGSSFVFNRTSDGQVATISRKPTTVEAMEGSGALASGAQWDLVVQAQVCAAINRHALDLNVASGVTQDWSNAAAYYVTSPYNWYCKFWHQADISYNQLTYAFCYDDVFDKSSTINCPSPTKATITIGGFAGTVTRSPYSGSAIAIPGVVEAENFDNGGEGLAYHDNDASNLSGAYRAEGVDIEACNEGGYNMDWSNNAEWTSYTVNVASAGSYNIDTRVASVATGGTFHIEMDGTNVTGTLTVPNTGGWQTWQTVSKVVTLTAGQHIMKYVIDTKEFNTNKFTFTLQTTTATNLALNKATTVSSTESASYPGSYAVDGNTSTRWASAFSDPQWIYVDLGASYNVTRVKINWEAAYGKDYQIQVSANASTWTTIKTVTGNTALTNDNTGLSGTGRYVRIYGTARGTAYGYSIFDLEVYGTAATTGGGCSIANASGDYSISVSSDASNPTITFIPSRTGVGSPTCILYYNTTGSGTYPGYTVTANTAYRITAAAGQTVSFYYTYTVPEGGEKNTINSKNSFTVGTCSSLKSAYEATEVTQSAENAVEIFPVPMTDELNLRMNNSEFRKAIIVDLSGKIVANKMLNSNSGDVKLDVSQLRKGVYILRLEGENNTITKKLVK